MMEALTLMMMKYLSKFLEITQGAQGKPRYIGSVFFYIGYVAYLFVVGGLFGFLAMFLPTKVNFTLINSYNYFIRFWLSFTCGVRYKFEGFDNFPEGPCVIVSNHQSQWETLILQIAHVPTATVLKKELLIIPLFGWGLRALKPIAIDRARRKQAKELIHNQGLERIKDGMSVLIFPEGTRLAPDVRKRFAPTGVALAVEAGVPIIPIAHNAGYCWKKDNWVKHSGTISMTVGKPIDTSSGDIEKINHQAQEWVYSKLEEFQKID